MLIIIPTWGVFFLGSGIVGHLRGYPLAGWVLGFLLGPFGLLIMALSDNKKTAPDAKEQEAGNKIARAKAYQEQAALRSGLVKCQCGELIPSKESCPFCGAGPA